MSNRVADGIHAGNNIHANVIEESKSISDGIK
jgi:hypothetical protein